MSHYFTAKPESQHLYKQVSLKLAGKNYLFKTDSSVFARKYVDHGSRALIDTVLADNEIKRGQALDLGCGYGPIGIVLKDHYPQLDFDLVDINERAVELARENASKNKVEVQVKLQSGLANTPYDLVVSNPPIRTGKKNVQALCQEVKASLKPGGRFYLVLRKKQGAQSYQRFLEAEFGSCLLLKKYKDYRVFRVTKEAI